jgi:hypothetical protein
MIYGVYSDAVRLLQYWSSYGKTIDNRDLKCIVSGECAAKFYVTEQIHSK